MKNRRRRLFVILLLSIAALMVRSHAHAAEDSRHFNCAPYLEVAPANLQSLKGSELSTLKKLHADYQSILAERTRQSVEKASADDRKNKYVRQYVLAIEREIERRQGLVSSPPDLHLPTFSVSVAARPWPEVKADIEAILRALKIPFQQQLLRYFSSAREDLVLRFGTDRHGADFGHEFEWDQWSQLNELRDHGLRADDGIFAERVDEYFQSVQTSNYPSDFEIEFLEGGASIVVYDLNQFEDPEWNDFLSDLFVFKDRAHKTRSVVAIIRPTFERRAK